MYKGSDRTSLVADGQYDEMSMTIQGRYIGPFQSVWRLKGNATNEEKPPVMLMPFILKDGIVYPFKKKCLLTKWHRQPKLRAQHLLIG